jgi:hypothetical protein
MTQTQEKPRQNASSISESGTDSPKELKAPYQEAQDPGYTDAKRTWKSFFWSSEFPNDPIEKKKASLIIWRS